MAAFGGKWNLTSSEGFDDFMKALGVGLVTRKMGNVAKPTQEITVDGDSWRILTSSTFKTTDISFTIGTEFDETTADGRTVKTTCTMEGDRKMVQTQKGDPEAVLTRELKEGDDNSMTMTCKCKDVTCTRTYAKKAE